MNHTSNVVECIINSSVIMKFVIICVFFFLIMFRHFGGRCSHMHIVKRVDEICMVADVQICNSKLTDQL
jgi:hypothetical protein